MTASTVNMPLMRQVLAKIEANPDGWDQDNWRCETGMCFAGWAADLAGGEWLAAQGDPVISSFLKAEPDDDPKRVRTFEIEGKFVDAIPADARAVRVLGISWDWADALFQGSNDLAYLRELVAEIESESAS